VELLRKLVAELSESLVQTFVNGGGSDADVLADLGAGRALDETEPEQLARFRIEREESLEELSVARVLEQVAVRRQRLVDFIDANDCRPALQRFEVSPERAPNRFRDVRSERRRSSIRVQRPFVDDVDDRRGQIRVARVPDRVRDDALEVHRPQLVACGLPHLCVARDGSEPQSLPHFQHVVVFRTE